MPDAAEPKPDKKPDKKPQRHNPFRGKLIDERRELPDQPGVYLFHDADGTVVYVGKATSVKSRVSSHFSAPEGKAVEMIAMTERIECVVTRDPAEALITEQQFIRQYRPRFNVLMRDDKTYPFIAISLDEDYPRVYFTREKHKRGRKYFGPYSDARRARNLVELLGKIFQYRTCEGPSPGRQSGNPCLDYFIKRCQAPCVDYISKADYRANIGRIEGFLAGNFREVEAELDERMRDAAERREYEEAAVYRNRIAAVKDSIDRNRLDSSSLGMVDLVAIATDGSEANAQVFQVRDGILADRKSFHLDNIGEVSDNEVTEEFIAQYYTSGGAVPPQVIVARDFEEQIELDAITGLLKARRGSNVELRSAERGEKRKLFELAERNARLALEREQGRAERARRSRREGLENLREALELEVPPVRIECFDISNLGPTNVVASMVVFRDGNPRKADYRRFKVKELDGRQDDFASMGEVLRRRMAQYLKQKEISPHDDDYDESFASLPGLIVIDGGKGQLSSAIKELEEFRKEGVPVVSLAKREEEIFVPGRKHPVMLDKDDPGLKIMQRIRDEAHRFAITFHREKRDKAMTASVFDELPGVGPTRKKLLLEHFGSPDAVVAATRDQLESVPGVPAKLGRQIFHQLNNTR
ncbi:MAG: excinuclease ABC subunit UvrC [Thermoleophilaceae bacterium]|nr:excinuclease ABC subunit UvrC [Thermoleophilaceae bacterium]